MATSVRNTADRIIGIFMVWCLLCIQLYGVPHEKMNVVFILADDLGWADLTCYGADLHETPHLDQLASEGMRLTNAYAAAPVCSPTRASILSGKWPARLHMTIWRENATIPQQGHKLLPPVAEHCLPHEEITISEILKSAGYTTAHIGKWHLGDAEHYPETMGFDVNIGGTLWGAPSTFWYPYTGTLWGGQMRYVPHLEDGLEGEYLTDRLTDEAIAFLEREKAKPFFLNLWYHTVHTPIEGKPDDVRYYQDKRTADMHHQNSEYAAMVHSMDENVGRVLQTLDKLNLTERTVVIFFSDNGGYINPYKGQACTSNYPLRSGKGALYEGGIREPLIIRWPGITHPGAVSDAMVSSEDFYPTLIDLLDLEDQEQNEIIDGISLAPILRNPSAALSRNTLYWHYPHYYATTAPVSAVRQGDWKLLEYFEDGSLELYNLRDDIGEASNLAERMPDRVQSLHKDLKDWRRRVNAQIPTSNKAR
jgi:arylsulfatase A